MGRPSERCDRLLFERGLAPSRERARALIMAGRVRAGGVPVVKAGALVPLDAEITVEEDPVPYVSRGGVKLAHALDHFGLDPAGCVAMDVGASTGGFTDVLLRRGAVRVYAVDVGYGQLDFRLRNDPRVVVLERHNIRTLRKDAVPEPVSLATVDTSFISLRLVIPALLPFLSPGAALVALVKPQFEAGRGRVGKGGVVRDPDIHREVCEGILAFLRECGLEVLGLVESPILGPAGNREFLAAARLEGPTRGACAPP